ncbi:MAG: hypothetical protein SGARI_001665 [Bacillariaceae sp.]
MLEGQVMEDDELSLSDLSDQVMECDDKCDDDEHTMWPSPTKSMPSSLPTFIGNSSTPPKTFVVTPDIQKRIVGGGCVVTSMSANIVASSMEVMFVVGGGADAAAAGIHQRRNLPSRQQLVYLLAALANQVGQGVSSRFDGADGTFYFTLEWDVMEAKGQIVWENKGKFKNKLYREKQLVYHNRDSTTTTYKYELPAGVKKVDFDKNISKWADNEGVYYSM